MENKEAIGKIADGIGELIDGKPSKSKKSKKGKNDSISTVIDLAGTILKK